MSLARAGESPGENRRSGRRGSGFTCLSVWALLRASDSPLRFSEEPRVVQRFVSSFWVSSADRGSQGVGTVEASGGLGWAERLRGLLSFALWEKTLLERKTRGSSGDPGPSGLRLRLEKGTSHPVELSL